MPMHKASARVGAVVLLGVILLGTVAFFFSNAGQLFRTYRMDVLFARDHGHALMRAFAQTVDGQFQTLSAKVLGTEPPQLLDESLARDS